MTQTSQTMPASLKTIMPEWRALRAKLYAPVVEMTDAEGNRLDQLNAFIRAECAKAAN